VVLPDDQAGWRVVAAGPTTSIREEPYQARIIQDHGLRGVIGKGGMGERTLAACREHGCAYLHAVGGAAQMLAEHIRRVRGVYFLEQFGSPEAIWELEVEGFPAVVTMDTRGRSLHQEVLAASHAALARLLPS
jgi:fumarate hydratase class I